MRFPKEIHVFTGQKASMGRFPQSPADWWVTHTFTFHGICKHIHLSHFCYIIWQLLKIARLGFRVWSSSVIGGCINRKQWIVSASIKVILNKHTVTALSVPRGGHVHGHVLWPRCRSPSSGGAGPGVLHSAATRAALVSQTHPHCGLQYYTAWPVWTHSCYIIWDRGKMALASWTLCLLPLGPEKKPWHVLFNSSLQLFFCYQRPQDASHKADGLKSNHGWASGILWPFLGLSVCIK